MHCSLCESSDINTFYQEDHPKFGHREYFKCDQCGLIFLSPTSHLNRNEEKARYDTHQNNPDDAKYQKFLRRLVDPLKPKLKEGSCGLDFGCGPGPAIGTILNDVDVDVQNYDPFYFPDETLLNQQYDFITSTETVEHFSTPRKEFELLGKLLKPQGVLGLMTQVFNGSTNFKEWWYIKDPTHVSLYQRETFDWIADWMSWTIESPEENIIIYTKT